MGTDAAEKVKINPNILFAFGVDSGVVDSSIGQFKAYETTVVKPDADVEIEGGKEELPIVLCNVSDESA